jgi:hypothetical protein
MGVSSPVAGAPGPNGGAKADHRHLAQSFAKLGKSRNALLIDFEPRLFCDRSSTARVTLSCAGCPGPGRQPKPHQPQNPPLERPRVFGDLRRVIMPKRIGKLANLAGESAQTGSFLAASW